MKLQVALAVSHTSFVPVIYLLHHERNFAAKFHLMVGQRNNRQRNLLLRKQMYHGNKNTVARVSQRQSINQISTPY